MKDGVSRAGLLHRAGTAGNRAGMAATEATDLGQGSRSDQHIQQIFRITFSSICTKTILFHKCNLQNYLLILLRVDHHCSLSCENTCSSEWQELSFAKADMVPVLFCFDVPPGCSTGSGIIIWTMILPKQSETQLNPVCSVVQCSHGHVIGVAFLGAISVAWSVRAGQLAAGGVASVWRSWVRSPPGPW